MDATIFFFFERLQTDKRLFAWLQSNSGRLKRETTLEIIICYILSVITARIATFPLLRLKIISQSSVSMGPRGGARPWYLGAFATATAILPNALIQLLLYRIMRIIFAQEIEIGVDGIITDEEKEEDGGAFFRSLWDSSSQRKKNKRDRKAQQEPQSLPSASSIQRRQWFSSPPTNGHFESHSMSSGLPALEAPLTPVAEINLIRIVRRILLLHLVPKILPTLVLFPILVFQTRAIMGQITLPDFSSLTRSEWFRLSWGHLIPKLYRKVFKERKIGQEMNPLRPALVSRITYVAAWIVLKEIIFDKLLKKRTLSLQLNRSSSVPSLTSLESSPRRRRGMETEMQMKARREVSVSVSSILTLDYFAGLISQCLMYPWDVIMTNQQLKTNAGKGVLSIVRRIRELGPSSWRLFFRGLSYHFMDSLMMYFLVLFVFSNSRIMFNRIKIALRARRRRLKRAQREYIQSQTRELLAPTLSSERRELGEEEASIVKM